MTHDDDDKDENLVGVSEMLDSANKQAYQLAVILEDAVDDFMVDLEEAGLPIAILTPVVAAEIVASFWRRRTIRWIMESAREVKLEPPTKEGMRTLWSAARELGSARAVELDQLVSRRDEHHPATMLWTLFVDEKLPVGEKLLFDERLFLDEDAEEQVDRIFLFPVEGGDA